MSIHQPSFRILDLLDQLIFLAHGEVVYRGTPTNLARFFSNFGRPIPTNANQIEFVLDLISELEDSTGRINGLVEFNKTWKSPESSTNSIDNVVRDVLPLKSALSLGISKGKVISSDITNFGNVLSFANPLWIETLVLLKRSVTNSRRSREIFFTRLISVLITSLFFGSLYWQIDDSIEGVRQRLGFFPFAVTLTFLTTCQSISIYLQERYIFIRETAYNTYRRSSYVLSRCLVDIPTLGILTLAFSTVTFWTIGLAGGVAGFLFYFLVVCGSFWLGNSLVVFISGLVRNTLVGFTVMLSFTGYCLLFCGFFITKDRLPDYWIWFHYISLMKYPYEALMRSEFERQTKCFARGVEIFDGTPFADASGMNVTSSTCVTTGLDILQIQDVNDLNKSGNVCWLHWVGVSFIGFCFIFLYYLEAKIKGSSSHEDRD
ncbi:ABC transporter G family member 2 [Morus notabilis]|uniref:ABC transporter G family member 2 n=1 Tax=Morus notabilis TaxID=981085 RepID=W9R8L3_9ROSA|nr:ABC transporter G family member 2 [Morus notabilis]